MGVVSWVAIGAVVWILASVLIALTVGRIVAHADSRARTEYAEPGEIPAAWFDEPVNH